MEGKKRRLNIMMTCIGVYKTHVVVPEEMSLKEAVAYANSVKDNLFIESEIEWVDDLDDICEEDCCFESEC